MDGELRYRQDNLNRATRLCQMAVMAAAVPGLSVEPFETRFISPETIVPASRFIDSHRLCWSASAMMAARANCKGFIKFGEVACALRRARSQAVCIREAPEERSHMPANDGLRWFADHSQRLGWRPPFSNESQFKRFARTGRAAVSFFRGPLKSLQPKPDNCGPPVVFPKAIAR